MKKIVSKIIIAILMLVNVSSMHGQSRLVANTLKTIRHYWRVLREKISYGTPLHKLHGCKLDKEGNLIYTPEIIAQIEQIKHAIMTKQGTQDAPVRLQKIAHQLWDKAGVPHCERVPIKMMNKKEAKARKETAAFATILYGVGKTKIKVGIWLKSDAFDGSEEVFDSFYIAHEQGHIHYQHAQESQECELQADLYAARIVDLPVLQAYVAHCKAIASIDSRAGGGDGIHAPYAQRYQYLNPVLQERLQQEK